MNCVGREFQNLILLFMSIVDVEFITTTMLLQLLTITVQTFFSYKRRNIGVKNDVCGFSKLQE
jgi:hypothetical protein